MQPKMYKNKKKLLCASLQVFLNCPKELTYSFIVLFVDCSIDGSYT